jgi:hypothetical protein
MNFYFSHYIFKETLFLSILQRKKRAWERHPTANEASIRRLKKAERARGLHLRERTQLAVEDAEKGKKSKTRKKERERRNKTRKEREKERKKKTKQEKREGVISPHSL